MRCVFMAGRCDLVGRGGIGTYLRSDALPGFTTEDTPSREVSNGWHRNHFDVLSLQRMTQLKSSVHEVPYQGRPAITKIAV